MSYERSARYYDLFGARYDGDAASAGLTVEATYSDFAGTPFKAGGGRAVFIFK